MEQFPPNFRADTLLAERQSKQEKLLGELRSKVHAAVLAGVNDGRETCEFRVPLDMSEKSVLTLTAELRERFPGRLSQCHQVFCADVPVCGVWISCDTPFGFGNIPLSFVPTDMYQLSLTASVSERSQ
jgi:hypothetical protein